MCEGERALSEGVCAPQTNFGHHRDTYRLSAQSWINGSMDGRTGKFTPSLFVCSSSQSRNEGLLSPQLLCSIKRERHD